MKLADYLAEKNLTDAAFAADMKVDRSTVTKWKLGTSFPDFPNQMKIARVTRNEVTPNDFLPQEQSAAS